MGRLGCPVILPDADCHFGSGPFTGFHLRTFPADESVTDIKPLLYP
jgi:hypothetical protein